jgi:membrane-bound metal-dependent hydrolase YbcI (DUF457 family)
MPLAMPLAPGLALGTIWWGMVGGGFPDWFDLRSEFRRSLRLRHRGASHGLPVGAAVGVGLFLLLSLLSQTAFVPFGVDLSIPAEAIWPWTIAFTLGFLSHLLADAATHAGIRPLLPFSDIRVWILPRFLRGKSSGPLDAIVRFVAMLALLVGLVAWGWLRAST